MDGRTMPSGHFSPIYLFLALGAFTHRSLGSVNPSISPHGNFSCFVEWMFTAVAGAQGHIHPARNVDDHTCLRLSHIPKKIYKILTNSNTI
jgi:hypothetical protein